MCIEEPGKDVRIVSVTPLTSANVQLLGRLDDLARTTPYGMQPRGPGYPLERDTTRRRDNTSIGDVYTKQ